MNIKPIRVQRRRAKGWKMPENTVSVTRPGRWGNPFPCGGNNALAVESYREWIEKRGGFYADPPPGVEDIKRELRGKNLACWCKVGEPCHADVLLEIANS